MRSTYLLLLVLALAMAGCNEGFPDEEMHFGLEDKVRPYAVHVQPPEAAPGETVQVTFFAQAPDPDEVDATWRAALDFDRGLYGADEVERRYVEIPTPLQSYDTDGFMTQTFLWTVPDSVHLWTSAIPDVLADPVMVALAAQLVPEAGSPPRKAEVDAWLRNLSTDDVSDMDEATREATWALADRFACQIRLRARLQAGLTVDVTRNFTVRHTGRLDGPNANLNPDIMDFIVIALDKKDADRDDIWNPDVARNVYSFEAWMSPGLPGAQVPVLENWTYYAVTTYQPQAYTSPYQYEGMLMERAWHRWYYYRQDAPGSGHQFYLTEGGEEAEMWNLDYAPRLAPAGVGSRFRIVSVVRDERPEWEAYHAGYGTTVMEGIVEFVAP